MVSYEDQLKTQKLDNFSRKEEYQSAKKYKGVNTMEMQENTQENVGKGPEKKFSAGLVTATVWANQTMINNQPKIIRNVNLEKRFKDKDGNWQSSKSLDVNDIPKANLVLDEAFKYITLREHDNS